MKAYRKRDTFPTVFSRFLEAEGLTENNVAVRTGRSQSAVSNWKTGKSPPCNSSVALLAACYPDWADRFLAARLAELRAESRARTDRRPSG